MRLPEVHSFSDIPIDTDTAVSLDEVARPEGRYLRALVFRRIGGSDEWLFDGLERIDVPLVHGANIARTVLREELRARFGVSWLDDGTVPS
jgi:hypothetical protein